MPNLFIPLTSESSLLSKDIIHNQTQGGTDGNPHAGAAAAERVDQKISASDTTPPGLDKNDMWIDTANLALKYNTGATGNTEQFTGSLTDGSETVSTALTDPVGMSLAVDGAQTNTTQSAAYTDQARTDRQSLSIGGNTDPENVSFTVTGRENTAGQSYSTTLADTGTETFTPTGNQDATGTLTFTGTESTIGTGSFSQTGVTDGQAVSYSVGGNTAPRDATVTLTGKSESSARGPVTITDSGSATIDPQGTRVEDAQVSFTGMKTVESRTIGDTGAGGSGFSINGNSVENAEFSVSLNSDSFSMERSGDRSASLTVPSDAISREYTIRGEARGRTVSYRNDLVWSLRVNGNEIKREEYYVFDDNDYYNDDLQTTYQLSPGDTVEIFGPGDEDTYFSEISISYSDPGTGTTTVNVGDSTKTITDGGSTDIDVNPQDSFIEVEHTGDESINSWSLAFDDVNQTKDPSLTVDGETVSHTGTLADGETVTKTLTGLTPGSHTADVSVSGPLSTSVEWTDITETTDPSVSIGSSTVSHTGVLNPGQTVTESVSIPDAGSGNATVSVTGPVDVDGSWTEVRATENPSVDVDGTSVSHTGVLAAGETASPTTNVTLAPSGATLSASTNGEDVGVDVDYTAVTHPEDIQITDVTSGQVAVSNSGVLSPGASMSDTYTGLPTGSVTIEIDGANLTPPPVVDWEIAYDEVTASDVTVLLDGEETPVGILKSGETQTVSTTPRNLSGSLTFEINDTVGQTNSYTLDLEEASFVKLS